jgi:1-acyl-sn-glycerol-3-phosphate acyltransferase
MGPSAPKIQRNIRELTDMRFAPAARSPALDAKAPPRKRGDFYWLRLPATGLCFAVFGLAAALLGLIVLPVLGLARRDPLRRRHLARAVISAAMRAFVYLMRAVRVLDFTFAGRELLGQPGQIIVANHPTLIDVIFLLGFTPQATCIVKQPLFANIFTRGALRAADYIPNAPTDEMVLRAERELRAGQTLVIFPEGTRTVRGRALELQRGAANIALRGATALTPVFISCEPPTLSKNEPWYRIPPCRARFALRVGAGIDMTPFRAHPLPKGSRLLNTQLAKLFESAASHPDLRS